MSQTAQQIEQIEMSIEEAKRIARLGERAERLSNNADFKKIVLDGYFKEEAARLTSLLNDVRLNDAQANIIADLTGIASFRRYLSNLVTQGHLMAVEIEVHSETLEELRNEEDEDAGELING